MSTVDRNPGTEDETEPTVDAEESIETVRDILTGEQSREFRARFAQLEERLSREISAVREELRATFEPFKQLVRSELASLGEGLSRQDGRMEGQGHSFDSKIVNAEERAAERLREVEGGVIERARQLSDDIRRRNEAVMTAVQRALRELDSRKPDRTALAAMLSELSRKLTSEASAEAQGEEERSTH
jgi:hypothetical protein